jgi:hypothetical protein
MAESQQAEAARQPAPERVERSRELAGEEPASLLQRAVAPTFQGGRIDPRRLTPQAILALQRTAGNNAVNALLRRQVSTLRTVQRRGAAGSSAGGTSTDAGGTRSLADIERDYRAMIKSARDKGYNVAADNLQHWLDASGTDRVLDVTWLRGNSAVTGGEHVNQGRFERQLKEHAGRLVDGASETFSDHWDRALTASVVTELYYASGTSELSSTGSFTLVRSGRTVTITGTVRQHWHDPYNWNAGQGAYIPGFGAVSDDDALALKAAGKGADYNLLSDWQQTASGTVDIGHVYNSIDLTWSGP